MFRPDQNRALLFADSLRTVAGVVILTALGVAPLNYASTRLMPFETLIALIATAAAAWLLAGAFSRSWHVPPRAARWATILILGVALAWWLVLEQPEVAAFTRRHYARLWERWPNSLVPRDFGLLVAWALAGLAALYVLCDLLRDHAWRRATAVVMVGTGAAVAVLGLLENATRAASIYWQPSHRMPGAFFGTFYHHTSAGAYLNTVWPLGLGLALLTVQRGAHSPRRRVLLYASLLSAAVVLVAHAGHVSRLPQVIAAGALVAFALWAGVWPAFARVRGLRIALLGSAALLAALLIAFGATRMGDIRSRWNLLKAEDLRGGRAPVAVAPESQWGKLMRDDLFVPSNHRQYPLGDRGAAYAVAIDAVRERPWFGWGPGGWAAAAAAHSADPFLRTFFLYVQFTHNDLLQTCVEWGLLGAAGWTTLIAGGAVFALGRLGTRPATDLLGASAVVALLAVCGQSVIDFPLQIPAIQLNVIALAAFAWTVPSPASSFSTT